MSLKNNSRDLPSRYLLEGSLLTKIAPIPIPKQLSLNGSVSSDKQGAADLLFV